MTRLHTMVGIAVMLALFPVDLPGNELSLYLNDIGILIVSGSDKWNMQDLHVRYSDLEIHRPRFGVEGTDAPENYAEVLVVQDQRKLLFMELQHGKLQRVVIISDSVPLVLAGGKAIRVGDNVEKIIEVGPTEVFSEEPPGSLIVIEGRKFAFRTDCSDAPMEMLPKQNGRSVLEAAASCTISEIIGFGDHGRRVGMPDEK